LRAGVLRRGGHEGPVQVVAGGGERPVGRARQRRGRGRCGEDPFQRAELPGVPVVLVDQDRGLGDVEALDGRGEEVPAHVGYPPGNDLVAVGLGGVQVGGVPGRGEARLSELGGQVAAVAAGRGGGGGVLVGGTRGGRRAGGPAGRTAADGQGAGHGQGDEEGASHGCLLLE